MPIIASVKPRNRRRERFVVAFQDEREAIELDAEITARACLAEGRELTEQRIQDLLSDDERQRCRTRAWSLLARRQRTRAELRRALRQRRFRSEVVEEVVEHIVSLGHLDDHGYAIEFASRHAATGKAGPLLVKQKLQARGVDAETIDQALAPVRDDTAQRGNARALLEKWNRRPKPEDPRKRQAAAAAFLGRRGFEAEVVWETVRAVMGDTNSSE